MKHFSKIVQSHPADDANAVAITLAFSDGTGEVIEFERADLPKVIQHLFLVCQRLGEMRATTLPLVSRPPDEVVQLPTDELQTVTVQNGALWLRLRAGSADFSIAFPDSRSARALGTALLAGSAHLK